MTRARTQVGAFLARAVRKVSDTEAVERRAIRAAHAVSLDGLGSLWPDLPTT